VDCHIYCFNGNNRTCNYRLINPEEVVEKKKRVVQITQLEQPPSIGEQQEIEEIQAPPLKSTIKFTPPVVKPDEQVTDEYMPTVDELKEVDPGAETQQGVEGGVDYSLIEVEEKVVEKKKKLQHILLLLKRCLNQLAELKESRKNSISRNRKESRGRR